MRGLGAGNRVQLPDVHKSNKTSPTRPRQPDFHRQNHDRHLASPIRTVPASVMTGMANIPLQIMNHARFPHLNPLDETTSHSTRLPKITAKSLVIPQAVEEANERNNF
ncbi:MAG: hypothetical protein A2V79_01170 [Betaproteobacteria bacterium RBG_16_56_24]|nr:MAG: hypothetical protein A2V79_01170 [Betaproteobacteria bacterium RBG_16_56_24]